MTPQKYTLLFYHQAQIMEESNRNTRNISAHPHTHKQQPADIHASQQYICEVSRLFQCPSSTYHRVGWPCLCVSVLTRAGNPGNSCQGTAFFSPCPLTFIGCSTCLSLARFSLSCSESWWCSSFSCVQQLSLITYSAPIISSVLSMCVNMCLQIKMRATSRCLSVFVILIHRQLKKSFFFLTCSGGLVW